VIREDPRDVVCSVDISKAREVLGWPVSVDEGLRRVVEGKS
jgi:nucleoside-diphosphate-sugar epimerase